MSLTQLISLSLAAILVENFVLVKLLDIPPFLGTSKRPDAAFGMGLAVALVMSLSPMITWPIDRFLLVPLGISYMGTLVLILVIAALVWLLELLLKKFVPSFHAILAPYLALVATNCAVLGVALWSVQTQSGFWSFTASGVCFGFVFALAAALFAGVWVGLDHASLPKCLEGFPQALITAGLIAMVLIGFSGLRVA